MTQPVSYIFPIQYRDNFTANGIVAGFDINQSGYGEANQMNATIRPIPWSTAGTYTVVAQVGGLQPRTRTYQVTVYRESDYGALRALVGAAGLLTTAREGSPLPGQPQAAILNGVRRGSLQFPGWPAPGDGNDIQTLVIDFVMLV
jgi:hypothetical protein